jgi:hypothetical protein
LAASQQRGECRRPGRLTLRVLVCSARPYENVSAHGELGHSSCRACAYAGREGQAARVALCGTKQQRSHS